MAVNPQYGDLYEAAAEDPNGTPGQTAGNVPVTQSTSRTVGMPTAGMMTSIPPGNRNPHLDPLDESFGIPGPNT